MSVTNELEQLGRKGYFYGYKIVREPSIKEILSVKDYIGVSKYVGTDGNNIYFADVGSRGDTIRFLNILLKNGEKRFSPLDAMDVVGLFKNCKSLNDVGRVIPDTYSITQLLPFNSDNRLSGITFYKVSDISKLHYEQVWGY